MVFINVFVLEIFCDIRRGKINKGNDLFSEMAFYRKPLIVIVLKPISTHASYKYI